MKNLILVNRSSVRMPRAFLKKWLQQVVRQLARRDVRFNAKLELSIVFLSEPEARSLNHQYRRRDYATDVLSFSGDDQVSLGELVICPEVVQKQAKEHGLSFRAELAYMVLHGLLHLLGYDHEGSRREARRMFHLQDAIFAQLERLHSPH